jgi:uncharacterized protein YjdB
MKIKWTGLLIPALFLLAWSCDTGVPGGATLATLVFKADLAGITQAGMMPDGGKVTLTAGTNSRTYDMIVDSTLKEASAIVANLDPGIYTVAIQLTKGTQVVGTGGGSVTARGGENSTIFVLLSGTEVVTGLTLDKTSLSLSTGAQAVTLTPTVVPADIDPGPLTWKSSDDTVASVDQNGVVTPLKAGTAMVTVENSTGTLSASCLVTVSDTVPDTGSIQIILH